MSPPLRAQSNQGVLWNASRRGQISTIATDHAPFRFADQKKMGVDGFTKIPNGIPSIQERVDLVPHLRRRRGRLGLQAMVDACSTQAAKLFGLYPRKGAIQLGQRTPMSSSTIRAIGALVSKECSYSNVGLQRVRRLGAEGPRLRQSRCVGKVQAREGEFVGNNRRGQFLKRSQPH